MIRGRTFLDAPFRRFDLTLNMTMERPCEGSKLFDLFGKWKILVLGGRSETDP
jgi:hypothetical protein